MLIELSIDFDYTEDEGKALLFLADLILISWFQLISNRKKIFVLHNQHSRVID
jgi:hypothetical protein